MFCIDVNPYSLGIETAAGMTTIIPRNTPIPCIRSRTFPTDGHTSLLLNVFEGESVKTEDNHLLGRFEVSGLVPAPSQIARVEITLEVDVNGICSVSVRDKTTSQKSRAVVQRRS